MVTVQAELERFDAVGLEVIKLCGYVAAETANGTVNGTAGDTDRASGAAEPVASGSPGWVSVIDLDRYFARRAELVPEAFGLSAAEASHMACTAERDRFTYSGSSTAVSPTTASPTASTPHPEAAPSLHIPDPWEMDLSEPAAAPSSNALDRFPLLPPAQASAIAARTAQPSSSKSQPATRSHRKPPSASSQATTDLAPRTGYDHYREFIRQHSSWFAQTVKDNPRLHQLAKQRQHYTIGTLSHYLVDTLAQDERLVDLVPAQKRNRGCGLIFTDQRAIALSQPSRRAPFGSLRSSRKGLQVWMVPWGWVRKVELGQDAICFHYGRSKERFTVDLEAPYHLRNAIPRDIPVRMVQAVESPQKRAMETKAGLAMIAGVMFAIGSGFSYLSTVTQEQRLDARSGSLSASQNAIAAPSQAVRGKVSSDSIGGRGSLERSAERVIATPPLVVTSSHKQCVDSFNAMAQPHAYATFNQITRTLQVNLQLKILDQMPQQQFDKMAAVVAGEVLASCQSKIVSQVVVTDGTLRYQQQRSTTDVTSSMQPGALPLF